MHQLQLDPPTPFATFTDRLMGRLKEQESRCRRLEQALRTLAEMYDCQDQAEGLLRELESPSPA